MNDPVLSKVYAPVRQCIYCGDTTGPLGKEHIIPYGLDGGHVLPRASCPACSRITGKVEEVCLRNLMGKMRARLNLPTRSPQKRGSTLPLRLCSRVDGRDTERILPIEEFPVFITGYLMPPPGILRGQPESTTLENGVKFWIQPDQKAAAIAGSEWQIPFDIDPDTFGRLIAKIAHSFAVAELGLSRFQPMLLDMILGRTETGFGHLVGRSPERPPDDNTALHFMRVYNEQTPIGHCLMAEIRLFCCFGAPTYFVVVGKL